MLWLFVTAALGGVCDTPAPIETFSIAKTQAHTTRSGLLVQFTGSGHSTLLNGEHEGELYLTFTFRNKKEEQMAFSGDWDRFRTVAGHCWRVKDAIPFDPKKAVIEVNMHKTTLPKALDFGEFALTLTGTPHKPFLHDKPCLWSEWAYGRRGAGNQWESHMLGGHSEQDLVAWIVREDSVIELPLSWRTLRPHLSPTRETTYNQLTADAFGFIREWLATNPPPVTVAEYCLTENTTYYGRVVRETDSLPPEPPDFQPGHGVNHVLLLSDVPLSGRTPSTPLTPLFQGWRY